MTEARIKHYRKLGWKLRVDHWTNHHNGNDEETIYFKSPRLKEEQPDYHARHDLIDIDETRMLAAELRAYVKERLARWENEDALLNALIEALAKDADAKEVTITVKLA